MTEQAVNEFIYMGATSNEFRNRLTSGNMTREEIAAAVAGLDDLDVTAIDVSAFLNAGSFTRFIHKIQLYLDRRYSGGRPAGDNLPVSV